MFLVAMLIYLFIYLNLELQHYTLTPFKAQFGERSLEKLNFRVFALSL